MMNESEPTSELQSDAPEQRLTSKEAHSGIQNGTEAGELGIEQPRDNTERLPGESRHLSCQECRIESEVNIQNFALWGSSARRVMDGKDSVISKRRSVMGRIG